MRKKPIDFSKVEDKKSSEQSGPTQEMNSSFNEEIDPSEIHRAGPYFEFFKKDTVRKLFSRRWQNKEDGYSCLIEELKSNAESSGTDAVHMADKRQELMNLLLSAVERGMMDKIVQVKMKACDLVKELVSDSSQKMLDLKELSVIIGILVDFLSENNTKIREKSEETLKAIFDSSKFGFNDTLISILSKTSKMNKAITRYNH